MMPYTYLRKQHRNAPSAHREGKTDVKIPFEDLLDIMRFALDNALMVDFDGQLWKQVTGIPMGDPHSPGMTIGACGWMEREWLQTLSAATKEMFMAKRYMDDILMFYVHTPHSTTTGSVRVSTNRTAIGRRLSLKTARKTLFSRRHSRSPRRTPSATGSRTRTRSTSSQRHGGTRISRAMAPSR